MTADTLWNAIGEIQDELILEAEAIPYKPRGRVMRNLIAACLILSLIAIPVSAEMRTGYISNLLAPLYGNAQTELVDSVGVPIGVSSTVGDYTLTADAVIGDRYNIAVVYSLRRNDGGTVPQWLRFDGWDSFFLQPGGFLNSLFGGGGGGGSLSFYRSEDGKTMHIIEQWESSGRLFWSRRKATSVFTDLELHDPNGGEATLVQKGVWEMNFTIRYKDTTTKLSIDDLEVSNEAGDKFTVHKVELSPFGVRIKLTVPNPNYGKPPLTAEASEEEIIARGPKRFAFAMKLKDGSVIKTEGGNSSSGNMEKETLKGDFHAMFDIPVPLKNIEALIFCGTEYPVDFS